MNWKFECVHGPIGRPIVGLAWSGSAMLFSDPTASQSQNAASGDSIMAFNPRDGKLSIARKYANRTHGIAFGHEGELFACQAGGRRVIRMMPDGSSNVTATRVNGRVQNHPRFIAMDGKGRAWLSDRYHPLPAPHREIHGELDHQSVLRLTERRMPHGWHLERMTTDTTAPAGVAVSPDGRTLFVSENNEEPKGMRELRAYPIRDDDALDPPVVLHTFGADRRGAHRGIEGLCVDVDSNVFACAGSAAAGPGPLVYVFSPRGAVRASYEVPEGTPLNCAFGDAGLDSLYVSTVEGHLYRIKGTGYKGYVPFRGGDLA